MPSRPRFRLGCFGALLLGVLAVLFITAIFTPWAFHIDGQFTPAFWSGYGKLRTQAGDEYPLFINIFPDFRHGMSRLRLNGQRPTAGIGGRGWLCSAPGVTQRLDLSGTIFGAYLSTDGNQMAFRLLDWRRPFQINYQHQRYFDLYGRWRGPDLVMQDDGGWERGFHPGPHNQKDRASVTFARGNYSDFKSACSTASIPEKARIPPPRD